jgi:transcriptional regulator with XRE-family HTH domain
MRPRNKPKRLAGKLLAIREHLSLSQTQLVKRLDLQMAYSRISEFELGRRFPPAYVLLAYARAAGIHVEDLIDDDINLKL